MQPYILVYNTFMFLIEPEKQYFKTPPFLFDVFSRSGKSDRKKDKKKKSKKNKKEKLVYIFEWLIKCLSINERKNLL